jgi:hypothetical protein
MLSAKPLASPNPKESKKEGRHSVEPFKLRIEYESKVSGPLEATPPL